MRYQEQVRDAILGLLEQSPSITKRSAIKQIAAKLDISPPTVDTYLTEMAAAGNPIKITRSKARNLVITKA